MRKLLIPIAISAVLSGCGKELPPVPEPESRPAKLFTVSVGNAQFERHFPATTEAGDRAVLTFRVPGLLQTIEVNEGQVVSKGDVLASLNPDEYSLLEQQARANFLLADVQYKRYQKLRKDQVVSEQDFDEAKANHNSAKAQWNQAKANLRYTKLVAPYDGTISYIPAENHEYVAAKEGVMNIQSNQLLKVIFQIPDYLLNRYTQGSDVSARMIFDAFPEQAFDLTFQEIDTEADPKTGSYKVTMVMERPSEIGLLPGMSGNAYLLSKSAGATKIPNSALLEENGKTYVWRVDEQGIVSKAAIEMNDKNQVLAGLNDGDQIIISGVSVIEPGIKVRAWIKERGL
ncbi:TPA: efflux RND transporter periplasmic adaptor subunit [Vibrio alginolyticus]|uniref:Efflux RND transporter periplasmic adaptor subunit n=1 Tax=Vibrio alginolyticus TaxID=663 RepID=A0A7Y4AYK7_VIBAL|nr:efflux RND transporter periplasmic adaptor subunit [Vibrio alginolyticus]EGQ7646416.1 efflux RND transporter periplasmic adaptor subunit [Vibrio alginolyticus]EGQ8495088.1 efflux RND transporter periplasmic adaptor subunit [Vibrio alginolyticus]ELA8174421.1 efflux RND transporter periplasmic adaptor subunit [Vibrio alginolyticus]ELA8177832.1 efflux RND transporter periplasmic adaptor subunit [Vibrio alginolyticus]ELB1497374.1 efflux RND transporter periplasmic adaptor subunit [Vibrio algino